MKQETHAPDLIVALLLLVLGGLIGAILAFYAIVAYIEHSPETTDQTNQGLIE